MPISEFNRVGVFFMENKKQNEEIQSRRDFFKKAAKSALPILGAVLLANTPTIVKAAEPEPMRKSSSKKINAPLDCWGSCYGSCYGSCLSCYGTCTSCTGTCTSCTGTCTSCYGTCVGTCVGTCMYTCWGLAY